MLSHSDDLLLLAKKEHRTARKKLVYLQLSGLRQHLPAHQPSIVLIVTIAIVIVVDMHSGRSHYYVLPQWDHGGI